MDLIVRTPKRLRQRIKDDCWFSREITEQGILLYDKRNKTLGAKKRKEIWRQHRFSQKKARQFMT